MRTNSVLVCRMGAGQQGRQGQASLFPANYNQVSRNMTSNTGLVYKYEKLPTTTSSENMQAPVIVDDTVHNGIRGMNNGLLTTSAQSVVANHSLQQEAVMKPGSSMSESNKNYGDLSEIEDIFSYFE